VKTGIGKSAITDAVTGSYIVFFNSTDGDGVYPEQICLRTK
jgi:hypothetical protein